MVEESYMAMPMPMGEEIVAEQKPDGGNLHILIIVVVVCAVLGLALGIVLGKRAMKK